MQSSVVVSAYNGEKYIEEQLDSLLHQTIAFDEVILGDDCSSDGTPKMIQNYMKENMGGTRTWSLWRNSSNKGWRENFHELLYQARGDLVFPCDQDDFWHSNKHEVMAGIMRAHPEIDLLASLVKPVYEDGAVRVQDASSGYGDAFSDTPRIQDITDPKSLYVTRPGCSFCVRRSFLREIEPFWDVSLPHDAVMWVLAEAKGSLGLLDRQLVDFRRHSSNASDRRSVSIDSRREDIVLQEALLDIAEAFMCAEGYMNKVCERCICEKRKWLSARRCYLFQGKFSAASVLVSKRNLYASVDALCADLVLGLFPKARLHRRMS